MGLLCSDETFGHVVVFSSEIIRKGGREGVHKGNWMVVVSAWRKLVVVGDVAWWWFGWGRKLEDGEIGIRVEKSGGWGSELMKRGEMAFGYLRWFGVWMDVLERNSQVTREICHLTPKWKPHEMITPGMKKGPTRTADYPTILLSPTSRMSHHLLWPIQLLQIPLLLLAQHLAPDA